MAWDWDGAGLIGGVVGVLGAALAYIRGTRADRSASALGETQLRVDALNTLIDQQQEEISALRIELRQCRDECEKRISALELRLREVSGS